MVRDGVPDHPGQDTGARRHEAAGQTDCAERQGQAGQVGGKADQGWPCEVSTVTGGRDGGKRGAGWEARRAPCGAEEDRDEVRDAKPHQAEADDGRGGMADEKRRSQSRPGERA